jgi:hypothetical protein
MAMAMLATRGDNHVDSGPTILDGRDTTRRIDKESKVKATKSKLSGRLTSSELTCLAQNATKPFYHSARTSKWIAQVEADTSKPFTAPPICTVTHVSDRQRSTSPSHPGVSQVRAWPPTTTQDVVSALTVRWVSSRLSSSTNSQITTEGFEAKFVRYHHTSSDSSHAKDNAESYSFTKNSG